MRERSRKVGKSVFSLKPERGLVGKTGTRDFAEQHEWYVHVPARLNAFGREYSLPHTTHST
jgi:hypothetical protein